MARKGPFDRPSLTGAVTLPKSHRPAGALIEDPCLRLSDAHRDDSRSDLANTRLPTLDSMDIW